MSKEMNNAVGDAAGGLTGEPASKAAGAQTPAQNDVVVDAEQVDVLISKAVDGAATRLDWAMLEIAAHEKPVVWRELALTMRDAAQLEGAVGRAAAMAENVELPAGAVSEKTSSLRMWGGWAAAAVLGLMFFVQWRNLANQPAIDAGKQAGTAQASLIPTLTTDQARAAYLERGKQEGSVLGEVPTKVLVRGTPVQNGRGSDVIFIRQIVETARVEDLMRFTHDEAGQQRLMRLEELYGNQDRAEREDAYQQLQRRRETY